MKPQEPRPDSSLASSEANEPEPVWVPGYPWWVRVGAVLHVLSPFLAFVAFLVLNVIGGMVAARRGWSDPAVWMWIGLAWACPAISIIYRYRFEEYGRARWPDGKPAEKSPDDL